MFISERHTLVNRLQSACKQYKEKSRSPCESGLSDGAYSDRGSDW